MVAARATAHNACGDARARAMEHRAIYRVAGGPPGHVFLPLERRKRVPLGGDRYAGEFGRYNPASDHGRARLSSTVSQRDTPLRRWFRLAAVGEPAHAGGALRGAASRDR